MRLLRAVLLGCAAVAVAGVWVAASQGPDVKAVKARSDQFWGDLAVTGSPTSHFTTLDEMADNADIIVVGHIERLTAGREVRDLGAETLGKSREEASVYFADATIAVEETIKGEARRTVKLQLLLPNPATLGNAADALPTERAIYFLTEMGAYFAKEAPKSKYVTELKGTFDFVSPQGLLRDFGQTVGVTADEGDAFLHAAKGEPFAEVLANTKQVASD
jgi:hypothetical protein